MNPILIYTIKVAFYIAGFYLIYSLFLSKDTLYGRNRAFILVSLAASLILPLITIKTGRPANFQIFGKTLAEVLVTGTRNRNVPLFEGLNKETILLIIYLSGLSISIIKILNDFTRLLFLISKDHQKQNNIVTFSGIKTAAFSAFGHIFINSRLAPEDASEIIRHEQNHLDKNHFFDIILIQIIKAIQWFNPFIYMFDRSLRAVHEYQADEKCLIAGATVISYQQLLMNQILDTHIFSVTNCFSNPALIKKRMIMMTKKRSGILANLKILMVLPVVAVVLLAFSSGGGKSKTNGSTNLQMKSQTVAVQQADSTKKVKKGVPLPPGVVPPPPPPPPPFTIKNYDTTWVEPDIMPVFKGGDQAILDYVMKNTRYPELAKKNGIQGKVIVRFAVETNGSIGRLSVLRGVDPTLDAEALRVVGSLPHFEKPGFVKGKPVAVWYMLPVNYALK
jgi:TonB family protein